MQNYYHFTSYRFLIQKPDGLNFYKLCFKQVQILALFVHKSKTEV